MNSDLKILAIIPARLDSSRLPGKPMLEVNGQSLISYVISRAAKIPGVFKTVVATTGRSVDDALYKYLVANGVDCFRGETVNVAKRILDCALSYQVDYFVRVNGDCTFTDFELLGAGVALCRQSGADLVSNLPGRTFPYGIAVEIIKTSTYAKLYTQFRTDAEREHVTTYLYDNLEQLNVEMMTSPHPELAGARLVVDTAEDFEKFRYLVETLGDEADSAGYYRVATAYLESERTLL